MTEVFKELENRTLKPKEPENTATMNPEVLKFLGSGNNMLHAPLASARPSEVMKMLKKQQRLRRRKI